MGISIPVINVDFFLTGTFGSKEASEEIRKLHDACREYGAFYLKGHGIDNNEILKRMSEFFSLSEEVKQSLSVSSDGIARGFIGMGKESGSDLLEVKEAFSYGYSEIGRSVEWNDMQAENVWPASGLLQQGWQASMEEFYADMCGLAETLTRAFSLSYDKPEDYLSQFCLGGETISMMRLFHYYPYETADREFIDKKNRIGSSPHTDWGFLTLILQQEDVSGLQFWYRGEWHDINPEPGALIVNCGDYFSLLTGGEYVSPLHRVVSEGKERMSAVLFYYPSYDARIPMLANQDYSLFRDQQENGHQLHKNELGDKSFGQFIAEKWQQVKRS